MEEGKNEIMELRQMIEGCFERQNKLIARLEMELEHSVISTANRCWTAATCVSS